MTREAAIGRILDALDDALDVFDDLDDSDRPGIALG